ncbi:GNAT family acetyltransferase [Sphingopyxis sp. USTB-05]|uniref:GNAT family acetyltransferase n=1 Tax=Sphingopyxis sp. USTB-05 TaxID=2830667 RepID=UPI0020791B8D|nr:GNAT family acetyltransferase [Sphingopyxis sp. USTB-05]USI78583.1 GNAT family acetyltransferase [Sphingopyxis sp. USTB-05]
MIATRTATVADRDAVVAIWEACGLTRPWNDPGADFLRALGHNASTVILAERDTRIIGTAMTGFDGHRGWIYYLGVAPDQQGQGIARQLLDASCEWLRLRGCPKVELMLRDGNPAAGLYEHLGWEPQDVRVFARWLAGEDGRN